MAKQQKPIKEQQQLGNKEGDLRVWHIPQVPMKAYHVPVANVKEAKLVLMTLARYDQFQLENNVKPDFSNAQGLERYENVGDNEQKPELEWCEFYDDNGRDILELIDEGHL